jgi:predicted nucleic acid-binding protein
VADPRYLADTSVWSRIDLDEVNDRLEPLRLAGKLRTCRMVDLEVVYGSPARQVNAMVAQRSRLPEAPITPHVMDRALDVAQLLAAAGLHRAAKPADLLIAAAAEAAGLTVLHYDADYDRITSVTHQPTEWVAPAGSLAH